MQDKATALIMAVEEGRTRIVSMLVKAGAALDGQNKVGYMQTLFYVLVLYKR